MSKSENYKIFCYLKDLTSFLYLRSNPCTQSKVKKGHNYVLSVREKDEDLIILIPSGSKINIKMTRVESKSNNLVYLHTRGFSTTRIITNELHLKNGDRFIALNDFVFKFLVDVADKIT